MKGINKIAMIVTKILEIAHWVAVGFMAAVLICSAAAPGWLGVFLEMDVSENGWELSTYGFEVAAANSAGEVNMTTVLLFSIGALIILSLIAMVFRNLYLIIKKSNGTTPFQKDNIRMLREIGIFSISIPVVGLIMSIIIRLIVGVEAAETSVNLSGFIMGIIVLCLTQYFTHGADIEKDVDGLV